MVPRRAAVLADRSPVVASTSGASRGSYSEASTQASEVSVWRTVLRASAPSRSTCQLRCAA
jgi:hypothetical protein